MRFVRTLTATCIVALIAGCATPQDKGRTASTDGRGQPKAIWL